MIARIEPSPHDFTKISFYKVWLKHLKLRHIYAVWNRAVYHVLLTLCVVKPLYRVDFLLLHCDIRFVHVKPQQKHLAYLIVQESFSVKHLVCMVPVQSTVDKLCRIYCQAQLLLKLSECRRYIVNTGRYVSRA